MIDKMHHSSCVQNFDISISHIFVSMFFKEVHADHQSQKNEKQDLVI